MKTTLITILALICLFSYAQEAKSAVKIPRKAYKIIVKNNLSADDNFALVGKTLAENDFVIDKKDKEFYIITSGSRGIKMNVHGVYFLNFAIKEHSISVTGQFKANESKRSGADMKWESGYEAINFIGMSAGLNRQAFTQMQLFADKLGTNQEYIIE